MYSIGALLIGMGLLEACYGIVIDGLQENYYYL